MVKIKREDFMSLSYQGLAASLNVKKNGRSLGKTQCNFAVSCETSLTKPHHRPQCPNVFSFTCSELIMIMFWLGGFQKWGIPKTICFNTKMVGWFGGTPNLGNLIFWYFLPAQCCAMLCAMLTCCAWYCCCCSCCTWAAAAQSRVSNDQTKPSNGKPMERMEMDGTGSAHSSKIKH